MIRAIVRASPIPTIVFWILAGLLAIGGTIGLAGSSVVHQFLMGIVLIGLCFFAVLIVRRDDLASLNFPAVAWVSACLLWIGICTFCSGTDSWDATYLTSLISLLVLPFLGFIALRNGNRLGARIYSWILFALGIPLSVIAIAWFLLFPSMPMEEFRIGMISNPNQLAGLFVLLIPIWICATTSWIPHRIWAAATAALGTGLFLGTILMGESRGALLGLLLGLISMVLIRSFARHRWLLVICLGALLLLIFLSGVVLLWNFYGQYFQHEFYPHAVDEVSQILVENRPLGPAQLDLFDPNRDSNVDSRDLLCFAQIALAPDVREGRNAGFLSHNALPTPLRRITRWLAKPDLMVKYRLLMFYTTWSIWRDHPIFGVGPGEYDRFTRLYSLPPSPDNLLASHAHCLPLQLLAEFGFPGLLLWMAGVGLLLRTLVRQQRRAGIRFPTAAFFLGWCLLAVVFHNLADITVVFHPQKYILPMLIAMLCWFPTGEHMEHGSGGHSLPIRDEVGQAP